MKCSACKNESLEEKNIFYSLDETGKLGIGFICNVCDHCKQFTMTHEHINHFLFAIRNFLKEQNVIQKPPHEKTTGQRSASAT